MSKISALPELTTPANDDEIEIVDKSDLSQAASGTNKRIQKSNLLAGATPAAHATTHQNGGADEVSVAGLSGVLADPQIADKVRESSGPTTLTVGAVADGEFLKRSGSTIVSDAVAIGPATQIDETGGPTTLDIAAIADGQFLKRSGTDIVGDAPTASITPLVIEGANEVAQRNSTNNQNFNIYGVFNSTSDYKRIRIGWTSGAAEIFSEALVQGASNIVLKVGGGTALNLSTSGLSPSADTVFTLGASNYFAEIYNHTWITKAGGVLRFVGGSRLTGPAQGILNITDDSANSGSGTIRFDNRTPAQITSDQNNYSIPVTGYFIRLSTDASRTITGLTFGGGGVGDGQVHLLVNVGSNDIVLPHESVGSTATNRFLTSTGASITVGPNQAVELIRDGISDRWRVFKRN